MTIAVYEYLALGLLILAYIHFRKYNDEFIFLPVVFFWSTGVSRYNAVLENKADWVKVVYTRNIFTPMNNEKAMIVLGYFALGTLMLILAYRFFNRRIDYPYIRVDNPVVFNNFIKTKKGFILGLFVFFNIVFTIFKGMIGGTLALGQSYFLLFPMALGGLILLAFLVYRSYTWKQDPAMKGFYLVLMVYAIVMSYNPSQRFQFLSWMVAIGIVVTQNLTPAKKTWWYMLGGALVLFVFSLAGVARKHNVSEMTFEQMWDAAIARNEKREDQNMLDGFMMVLDVYPKHLNYHYGMEHLEILMRPIPRQLWPGKPVGGYANKLGLNKVEKGTVGISQTIYGTFYGEGGVLGIVVLSIFYAWLLVKLSRYTWRYNSNLHWLLKGIILASFVPILRGGDLPGVVAFIGMSYWPVFLILYQYNKYLKQINGK
ncbi:MAG: hypothetical protein QM786_08820 [Breznakibacter sp.]